MRLHWVRSRADGCCEAAGLRFCARIFCLSFRGRSVGFADGKRRCRVGPLVRNTRCSAASRERESFHSGGVGNTPARSLSEFSVPESPNERIIQVRAWQPRMGQTEGVKRSKLEGQAERATNPVGKT